MTYLPPLNGGRINATIGGNTAGAGSLISSGTMTLAGGNNVTLSQAGNAVTISGASQSVQTQGLQSVTLASNTAGVGANISSGAMTLAGGNNITLSQNGGNAVTIIGGGGGGGIALAGDGSTYTSGTANLAASGALTISALTAGQSLNFSVPQISSLVGTNGVTLSTSGNTISVGGAGGGGIALANSLTTYTSGTAKLVEGGGAITISSGTDQAFNFSVPQISSLVGTNGVTLSTSGNTISVGGAGGAPQRWQELLIRPILSNQTHLSAINGTAIFQPFYAQGNLTISRLNWEMSRATNGSNLFTAYAGIYSYVNETQISLLGSAMGSYSNTATANVSGIRRFGLGNFDNSTLAPGGYVLGMLFTAGNTLSMNYSLRGNITAQPQLGAVFEGADSYNTATSYNIYPFWGRYTTSSSILPSSVANSQIQGQFSGASQALGWYVGLNNN